MARPPSDEAFTEFVVASRPSLYRTAYLPVGDRGRTGSTTSNGATSQVSLSSGRAFEG